MKTSMKKILRTPTLIALLLVLCIVATALPATAIEDDPGSIPIVTEAKVIAIPDDPVNTPSDDSSPDPVRPKNTPHDIAVDKPDDPNQLPHVYYYDPETGTGTTDESPTEADVDTNTGYDACERNWGPAHFGQIVVAREGTTYYESADFAGSGQHGTANNPYTETLRIAGFARLDPDTGRLISYRCYLRDDVIKGKPAPGFVVDCRERDLWIATYTEGFTTGSVGWFHAYDLRLLKPDFDDDSILPPKDPNHDPYFDHEDKPTDGNNTSDLFDSRNPDPNRDTSDNNAAGA